MRKTVKVTIEHNIQTNWFKIVEENGVKYTTKNTELVDTLCKRYDSDKRYQVTFNRI